MGPSTAGIVPMKVREIIKLIETDGWYRIKAKGGHRQYKHPSNADVSRFRGRTVPNSTRRPNEASSSRRACGRDREENADADLSRHHRADSDRLQRPLPGRPRLRRRGQDG